MKGKTAEEQESLRFELAYYMSGQGEAPVLYVDWTTARAYDIFTGEERLDCMWYENGVITGFNMAVGLSGERFSSVEALRSRAFVIAPHLKYLRA